MIDQRVLSDLIRTNEPKVRYTPCQQTGFSRGPFLYATLNRQVKRGTATDGANTTVQQPHIELTPTPMPTLTTPTPTPTTLTRATTAVLCRVCTQVYKLLEEHRIEISLITVNWFLTAYVALPSTLLPCHLDHRHRVKER